MDVCMRYSRENNAWSVIVNGECFFEGTYEQAEQCFASIYWPE